MQSEKRKDRHDDNDQTDEIDYSVHMSSSRLNDRVASPDAMVRSAPDKRALAGFGSAPEDCEPAERKHCATSLAKARGSCRRKMAWRPLLAVIYAGLPF